MRFNLLKIFFKSKEMKLLRKIAGGDTHTIIYLKMMLISLEDGHSLTMSTIPVMRLRRNSKSVNVNYLKGLRMEVADVYFKAWDKRGEAFSEIRGYRSDWLGHFMF